jgi:hypothetical protein
MKNMGFNNPKMNYLNYEKLSIASSITKSCAGTFLVKSESKLVVKIPRES